MRSFATSFVPSIARGLNLRGAFTVLFTVCFAFAMFLSGCGGGNTTGNTQPLTQTINFTQPTSPVTNGSTITLSATATSGLVVSFSVDPTSTGSGTIRAAR